MDDSDIDDIRMVAAWVFAVVCVPYAWVAVRDCIHIIHWHNTPFILHRLLISVLYLATVAVTGGMAWWTVWKGRPSARLWAIAASIMQLVIFVRTLMDPTRSFWSYQWGALIVGTIALGIFIPRRNHG